jgi:Bacterial pre-peptidase C-terminal domain
VHVPIDTFHQTWHRLAKGESWGGDIGQHAVVQSAGGKILCEINTRITVDDPRDKILFGSHCQTHLVRMTPDFAYTIEMFSPDGKKLDPYLRLEDGAGRELAEDDDGAGNQNARIVFRPSAEDTYRIIATTFYPDQTGPCKVVVYQAPLLTGKVAVLPAVRIPADFSLLLLEKVLKAAKPVFAGAVLFDDKGKPAAGKALQFRWEKGATKLTTNDDGGVRLPLTADKVRGLVVEIPQGFKGALELTDKVGNPTALNLLPEFAKEKVVSAGGKLILEEKGLLTDTEPLDLVRKKGCYSKMHTLKMAAGSTYTIDLVSNDFNAFLRVEDPDGKSLAEDDDGAGKLNARIVFTPTADGVYRIIVTTEAAQQKGSYRLAVLEAAARRLKMRRVS